MPECRAQNCTKLQFLHAGYTSLCHTGLAVHVGGAVNKQQRHCNTVRSLACVLVPAGCAASNNLMASGVATRLVSGNQALRACTAGIMGLAPTPVVVPPAGVVHTCKQTKCCSPLSINATLTAPKSNPMRLQHWCISTSCCQSRKECSWDLTLSRQTRPSRENRTKNLAYKTVINFAYRQAISPAQKRTCSVVQLAHVMVCISESKSLRLAIWRVETVAGERRLISARQSAHAHLTDTACRLRCAHRQWLGDFSQY